MWISTSINVYMYKSQIIYHHLHNALCLYTVHVIVFADIKHFKPLASYKRAATCNYFHRLSLVEHNVIILTTCTSQQRIICYS